MGAQPGQTINIVGGAFVGSSDGSIDVEGGPAQGQIDLKLAGGVLGAAPLSFTLESGPVDFTRPAGTFIPWGTPWPNKPGFVFVPTANRFKAIAQLGAHVANPQCTVGQNVTFNDFLAGPSVTAAAINASIAQGTTKNAYYVTSSGTSVFPLHEALGVAPTIFISVAATVGTVFTVVLQVIGYFSTLIP